MQYIDFLKQKVVRHQPAGFCTKQVNPKLFNWQEPIVKWALKLGSAALFEECGLGKTPQQLSFAHEVSKAEGRPVLILAPLAVASQTKREGKKFDIDVNIAEMQADIKPGINITNYEKLDKFDAKHFSGIVLDESSILKSYMGKTKRLICEKFKDTPYKLACTATPAPNDLMELLNHAEFLNIMRSSEALSVWFITDQSCGGKYKLKGHAVKDFWQWVSSWSICIEKPSDIGFSDEGYILPKLNEMDMILGVNEFSDDFEDGLFRNIDMSATGFYKEKSRTVKIRAKKCAEIATSVNEQFTIWCNTNEEADMLKKSLPEAVEIRGSDSIQKKEDAAIGFIDGNIRILISKSSIFGFGLNFQNCHNSIHCGLNYSYEEYYQTVRRHYRFGQQHEVNIYRVLGSTEKNILDTLAKKEKQKEAMTLGMSTHMKEFQTANLSGHAFKLNLNNHDVEIPSWLRSESA